MRKAVALVIALAAAGCVSPAQQAANYCAQLGIYSWSPGYLSCIQMAQHDQDRRAYTGAAMLGAGTSLLTPQPNVYVFPRY